MIAKTRRALAFSAATATFFGLAMPYGAAQAAYPEKPITIMVAWAAGGATDLVARAIQPVFSQKLGTDLIIKNVAGAAGTIGTAEAARAEPDGYTVLITPTGPMTTQPHLRKIPYDIDSFAPVGRVAVTEVVMMATKASGIKTLEDVIKAAKAEPGKLKFGSAGAGTLPHIAILALNKAAGIDTKHIPYQGSANAVKALLGGEIDVYSDQSPLVPKYDLHPIVSWSEKPLPEYPGLPTLIEKGFDFTMANWSGVFVPKGTPEAVIEALGKALRDTLADPSVVESLNKIKVTIGAMDAKTFGAFAMKDYETNRELLREAGLLKK
ncbi:MAG: tripartite tricarboxylate transporter substrate binding protein [Burkholderiaceae bacterium]